MPIINEYSKIGEMVAKDYIQAFLKDVKQFSPEGIDYMRNLECLAMFHKNVVRPRNLNLSKTIQGENEIYLAVNIYNILNSEYGKN